LRDAKTPKLDLAGFPTITVRANTPGVSAVILDVTFLS
jgi:hypothetical protein